MDRRHNIRAGLHASVSMQGTDQWGKPFNNACKSVDFSRNGLGLLLPFDAVAPGTTVTINLGNKLHSNAVVQWTGQDEVSGQSRAGVRLINPKVSFGLRIVASVLLLLAAVTPLSIARGRNYPRARQTGSCVMSLAQMKDTISKTLGKYAALTESEKTFVHVQHQHMSCENYTKLYEKSDFFSDPKKREALASWHWNVYHAKEAAVRQSAVHNAESFLGLAQ